MLRRQIKKLGGPGNWTAIAEALRGRSSKSCRLRWCNQLNPSVKRGLSSLKEEDDTILEQHAIHGNKWAVISRAMPGRTDNQVKNRFNSTLRRLIASQKKDRAWASSVANSTSMAPVSPKPKAPSRPQSRLGDNRSEGTNAQSTHSRSKRERSLSPGESVEQASSPKRSRNAERSKLADRRATGSSGDSRGNAPRRPSSTALERQGLDNLIQASLLELERLKTTKGEIHEWGAMPYGGLRDCGTPEPTRSEEDGVVPTLLAPKPKRGGFSVVVPSDMYDWRSHSPALSAPFLAGLKRVDSLASLNGDAPSRPSSAMSVGAAMQNAPSMLQSDSWYARMLDNLGARKAESKRSVGQVRRRSQDGVLCKG